MKMMQTVNNTPTMRSRCQHTDQKGQVSMTEIDRWRDRSEYTKIMQSLERGDQVKKSAQDGVKKVIGHMTEFIIRLGGRQSTTPRENEMEQQLRDWGRLSVRKLKEVKKEEKDYKEREMK